MFEGNRISFMNLAKTRPQSALDPESGEGSEKPFFEKVKDIFG